MLLGLLLALGVVMVAVLNCKGAGVGLATTTLSCFSWRKESEGRRVLGFRHLGVNDGDHLIEYL